MAPRSEGSYGNGNGAEVVAFKVGDAYNGWRQGLRLGKAVGFGERGWYRSLVEALEHGAEARGWKKQRELECSNGNTSWSDSRVWPGKGSGIWRVGMV